jgi:hypothetical protein
MPLVPHSSLNLHVVEIPQGRDRTGEWEIIRNYIFLSRGSDGDEEREPGSPGVSLN